MAVLFFEAGHAVSEMHGLIELPRLLDHRAHQIFRQHFGKTGDVEDVFLGIQRGELAAGFRERVDDLRRRSTHARIEQPEDARGAAPDDGYVTNLLHSGKSSGCNRGTLPARHRSPHIQIPMPEISLPTYD